MTWRSIPDVPDSAELHYLRVVAPVAVPALLIGLLLWLGHIVAAIILAVVAVSVLVASTTSRRFRARIEAITVVIGRWAGRFLTVVVLGGVYFLVVTPGALALRVARRDLLQVRGQQPENTFWFKRPYSVDPLPERMFSIEKARSNAPNRGPVRQGRRKVRFAFAVSMVVAVLAIDLAAGTAWDLLRPPPNAAARLQDPRPSIEDPRSSLPAHDGDPWANELYKARTTTPADYAPFVGFLKQDIHVAQLNITDGLRSSYQPTVAQPGELPVIYFFGGSTMDGVSQRDQYTIPSYVARLAEADGIPVEVRNYGHENYLSRQEVTLLQQLLAAGERPDVVVFYDGHNDVDEQAWAINAKPSHHRASKLQAMVDSQRASQGQRTGRGEILADAREALNLYKRRSATWRLAQNLKHRFFDPPPRLTTTGVPVGAQRPLDDISQRVENAISIYAGSVDIAERLAAAYGFDVAFFWQPNIFTKSIVAGEESLSDPSQCSRCPWDLEDNRSLYLQATARIGPPVIDISDAFDGLAEPIMTDQVHTNERGAEVVAERIYSHIKPMIIDAYRGPGE